jgi:5-methyltetrahydrofolate--homocysteine methyltransferase
MAAQGNTAEKRGKIVLATVKGDIHDIGKNIVKTLLENYNFEVFDLGKNVEPEEIVRVTLAENAPLVGLSALMTTTVASMEETICQLKKAAPHVKIMVGGAVLTAEHAKNIGADHYSPDAMGAVRYAEINA